MGKSVRASCINAIPPKSNTGQIQSALFEYNCTLCTTVLSYVASFLHPCGARAWLQRAAYVVSWNYYCRTWFPRCPRCVVFVCAVDVWVSVRAALLIHCGVCLQGSHTIKLLTCEARFYIAHCCRVIIVQSVRCIVRIHIAAQLLWCVNVVK